MDMTIFSSRIFTGNPEQPWAEAIAIRGNTIVAVGTNAEVRDQIQPSGEVLELPGRLITPGFVDAHTHFMTFGMTLQWVDLAQLSSLAACRRRIQAAVERSRPGDWIVGRGWNQHLWEEGREPTREDIDDLTPDNPAMMIRICGHTVWLNSLALQQAGITKNTPDPEVGTIVKHSTTGELVGLLRGARHLIEPHIPEPSPEIRRKAALDAQQRMLQCGLTGIRSMETLEEWDVLESLDHEQQLKLRVYHLLPPQNVETAFQRGIAPGSGSRRLWFGQVKLFADGSLGSNTALLHEPYLDKPGEYGLPYMTSDVLRKNIELAYRHGCDVAIHAIGDKAVSHSLEAITAARNAVPDFTPRDSIEHLQLIRPQDLEALKHLKIIASMQPAFIATDWPIAIEKWGEERCRSEGYLLKTILHSGIPLQLSSDTPVESCNPLLGIYHAVTRQTLEGNPPGGWFPEQRLTLEEALRGYTCQHAWGTRREQQLRMLAPGRWADLTILQQDLFTLQPQEWLAVEAEMTIIDGEFAYQK